MRAAVIDAKTGMVLNVIVADPDVDTSPEPDTFLVHAGELPLTEEWQWTEADGWIEPALPPVTIPANATLLQQPEDEGPANVD